MVGSWRDNRSACGRGFEFGEWISRQRLRQSVWQTVMIAVLFIGEEQSFHFNTHAGRAIWPAANNSWPELQHGRAVQGRGKGPNFLQDHLSIPSLLWGDFRIGR